MTRRERLMATLNGQPVDRPAVSFYEIGGRSPDPDNPDPYNVFNAPGWRPLLELAEKETDLIRMVGPRLTPSAHNCRGEFFSSETWEKNHSRYTRTTLRVGGRTMMSISRRDRDVDTTWTTEHLLKDRADVQAYLQLPNEVFAYNVDVSGMLAAEQALGDAGIAMVNTGDPICAAAPLFSMADYTVFALTEGRLFHALLEKLAVAIHDRCTRVARMFPGRLWRICGSEYASEPYLPPALYEEYVGRYTGPMISTIQRHGGYARLHSHGRLRGILPIIEAMGPDGLDPIEPPPQGDMQLREVRERLGARMVLFGNIEASEIETLAPDAFETRVRQALREGTQGRGRGFVLMPSACPCGRDIPDDVLTNYRTMVRLATEWCG